MSEKVEDFGKKFRKLQLQNEAAFHIHAKEHRKALAVLRNLKPLYSDEEAVAKVYFMILESECHLRLKEYSAASAVFYEIDRVLTSSGVMPDDVFEMGMTFKGEKLFNRAYVAFNAACKLYLLKIDDAASGIRSAFEQMRDMTKEMVKTDIGKIVVASNLIPSMKKVLEELVGMPDNGSHEKTEHQASCYQCIARCCNYSNDKEQDVAMNEEAINIINEKLGDDADNYKITGDAYHYVGVAYYASGQRDKAKSAFNSAIHAKEKATDYSDDEQRNKSIEMSRKAIPWF